MGQLRSSERVLARMGSAQTLSVLNCLEKCRGIRHTRLELKPGTNRRECCRACGSQTPSQNQIHDCTGFCTDWLHLALTGHYCSLRGGWRDVVEEKDKIFIISSL